MKNQKRCMILLAQLRERAAAAAAAVLTASPSSTGAAHIKSLHVHLN